MRGSMSTGGVPIATHHRPKRPHRTELVVTEAARDAATFLLREPPLPAAARPGYALIAAGALSVLPPWAGEMLDLTATSGVGRVR